MRFYELYINYYAVYVMSSVKLCFKKPGQYIIISAFYDQFL